MFRKTTIQFLMLILVLLVNTSYAQNFAPKNKYLIDSLDLDKISAKEKSLIDSSLQVYFSSSSDTTKLNALTNIVENSWDLRVYPKYNELVLASAQKILIDKSYSSVAEKERLRKILANAIHNKAYGLEYQGDYENAKKYYHQSINYASKIGDKATLATSLNNVGYIYNKLGDVLSAIEFYDRSIAIKKGLNDTQGLAITYNNLGVIYKDVGEEDKAILNYQKSYELLNELNDERNMSVLACNIAMIHELNGETAQAIKLYNESINIAHRIEDYKSEAETRIILAGYLDSVKRHDESYEQLITCTELYSTLHDDFGLANTFRLLASHFLSINLFDDATEHSKKSYDIYKKLNDEKGIAESASTLARCYYGIKDNINAKKHALEALSISQSISNNLISKESSKVLKDIYIQEGNWRQAFTYGELYAKMTEQVGLEDKEINIQQHKDNYDLAKREKEIELLNSKNALLEKEQLINDLEISRSKITTIITIIGFFLLAVFTVIIYRSFIKQRQLNAQLLSQKAEIQQQNDIKEAMIKEIHHRVKNNLQVVSSLLRLQSYEIEDPKILEMFEDSQHRIISMALIHERMYGIDSLSQLDANSYFKSLLENLVKSYNIGAKVNLDVQVDQMAIGIETMIPLGLIINEIVNNSLKYAFKGRKEGTIFLRISRGEEFRSFKMFIGDDGVGIDRSEYKNGLGSELIKTFVDQLNGEIVLLENEPGTQYRVEFECISKM